MRPSIPIALIALSLAATTAVAGYKVAHPVTIDLGNRYAYGSLADTRATPDTSANLSCGVIAQATWGAAVCTGCNSAGDCFYCYSYTPRLIAAVEAMSSDSFLGIGWSPSGECSEISVYNSSWYAPRQP